MNKLKVAICISGHFRTDQTWQGIKNYILSNENIECDIFIHTWNVRDRSGGNIQEDKIIAEYQPKKYIIEPQKQFIITPLMEQQNFNKRDIVGLLSMFYKIEQCNELKKQYEQEHQFMYDCVVRTRGDLELLEKIDFHSFDLNKLQVPRLGDYHGLNDQFAFSNSTNMNIYSSTYQNIEKYLATGIWLNPEHLNKETNKHLSINRPDIKYQIHSNGMAWNNENRFPMSVMKQHGFL